MTIICKDCSAELVITVVDAWHDDTYGAIIYNGMYGCDSGCEYVRFEVKCQSCGFQWETGEFGVYEDAQERDEYLARFIKEYNKLRPRGEIRQTR